MPTTHVRCSDQVHKKLKEIAAQDGVSLSQALEILVSTLPAEGLRPEPSPEVGFWGLFGMEPAEGDPAKEVDTPAPNLDAISGQLESLSQNLSQFGEMQRFNIEAAVAQAFEERAYLVQLLEEPQPDEDDTDQHVHDGNCPQCLDLYRNYYHQGKDEIQELPGVREAIQFLHEQQERNAGYPGAPVVENWSAVPGVKELVEQYQISQTMITIVDSDPPQQSSEDPTIQAILASIRKSPWTSPGS